MSNIIKIENPEDDVYIIYEKRYSPYTGLELEPSQRRVRKSSLIKDRDELKVFLNKKEEEILRLETIEKNV